MSTGVLSDCHSQWFKFSLVLSLFLFQYSLPSQFSKFRYLGLSYAKWIMGSLPNFRWWYSKRFADRQSLRCLMLCTESRVANPSGVDPDPDPTFKKRPDPAVKKEPDPDPTWFRLNQINPICFFLNKSNYNLFVIGIIDHSRVGVSWAGSR